MLQMTGLDSERGRGISFFDKKRVYDSFTAYHDTHINRLKKFNSTMFLSGKIIYIKAVQCLTYLGHTE